MIRQSNESELLLTPVSHYSFLAGVSNCWHYEYYSTNQLDFANSRILLQDVQDFTRYPESHTIREVMASKQAPHPEFTILVGWSIL